MNRYQYHENSLQKVRELGGEIRSMQSICDEKYANELLILNSIYFETWLKSDERKKIQIKLIKKCMHGKNCGNLINLFSNITFAVGITFASSGFLTPFIVISLIASSFDILSKIFLSTKKTYEIININKQEFLTDEKQLKIDEVTTLYNRLSIIISSICTIINISLGMIDIQQALSGFKNILKYTKIFISTLFKNKQSTSNLLTQVNDLKDACEDLKDVCEDFKSSGKNLYANYKEY
jgi:hypothetical protein